MELLPKTNFLKQLFKKARSACRQRSSTSAKQHFRVVFAVRPPLLPVQSKEESSDSRPGHIQKSKKTQGILLVEALISIVILSVGITASIRSLSYASKIHGLTKNYLMGLKLLEEKIAELEALPELEEGETSGTFEAPYHLFSWTSRVEELELPVDAPEEESAETEPTVTYLKVSLEVNWHTRDARAVLVDTILTKKKETESAEEKSVEEKS
jgi:hypothetical protein